MASNPKDLVSGVRYRISDGKRTLELRHVETHSVSDGSSGQHVINANNEVMGQTRSGGGFTITLKVRSTQSRREVAWRSMQQSQVRFRFDIVTSAWHTDQYSNCTVSKVDESGGGGGYSLDITVLADDVKPITISPPRQ